MSALAVIEKFVGNSVAPGEPTEHAVGIAAYIREQLDEMSRFRNQIHFTDRLADCLRAREGKYNPGDLQIIEKFGGSSVFARLTTNKVRGAAAMLRGIFVQGERPWEIRPTPVPTLPEDITSSVDTLVQSELQAMTEAGQPPSKAKVQDRRDQLMQGALDAARKTAQSQALEATRYVDDILVEGQFYGALNDFLLDFATLPIAILRGPTAVMATKVRYVNGTPAKMRSPVLRFTRVDPYDIMWTPGAITLAEADVIERMRMTRSGLQALIGLDGYDEDAIRSTLREYGKTGYSEHTYFDQVRDDIQNQESHLFASNIDVLAFTGAVPGEYLLEYGIEQAEGAAIDPDLDYLTQVWICNKFVLKVQVDPDPRERHSYFAACYEPVPGSVIGTALPEMMGDIQNTYNAALRALVNNLGMASGPQVAVNFERIAPGADASKIHPWKVWYFITDPATGADKPIEFFQPNSNAQELMAVLSYLQALADEVSAIPRYLTGSEKVGGAGRTASGLSMLMGNATRTMTSVAGAIDANVIGPILQKTYDLILLTTGATTLRGDETIEPRGATYAEKRETDRMRMLEFLQYTNNPTDLGIIGPLGRASMLREIADTFVRGGSVVPPEHEMLAKMRAEEAQAQAIAQQQQVAAATQPAGGQGGQGGPPGKGGSPAKPAPGKGDSATMAQETDNMHRTNPVSAAG